MTLTRVPYRRSGRARPRVWLGLVAAVFVLSWAAGAHAQQVTVSAERAIYAGLPFTLSITAEGFDEEPQPEVEDFDIPGCKVTFMGVSPSFSTSITILNGRRTQTREVRYEYRYRVQPEKPGSYKVPAITVTQGGKKASSRPGTFRATDIATSDEMHLELEVPDRPVTVGETFEVAINWYLRREVRDHDFVIPLFDETQWVDVHQPKLNGIQRRQTLAFPAGDREIELPYGRSQVTMNGREYTRFHFRATVTPIKAGTLEIEPARVVAKMVVGSGRDAFGFRTARTKLFKAADVPRTLQIRPLPAKGRPLSFENAVGTAFSIQVQASRTVVQLGEPVELEITVRGDGRLEGLSLPRLDNPEGLPTDLFSVPDTPPTGEIIDVGDGDDDAKAKRFRVTVQVKSPEVREIPPIAFSYYNPETGGYETVRSQPIALSVEGSSIVGAGDVVSAGKKPAGQDSDTGSGAAAGGATASLVGADLSLSASAKTLDRPWSVGTIAPVLYALYVLPLLLLGFRLWQVSTRDRRGKSSETRKALRAVEREIDQARSAPARDAGPAILAALRALATAVGQSSLRGEDVIARIETESYSPKAADAPLSADILAEARQLASTLAGSERGKASAGARAAAAVLVPWLAVGLLGSWSSPAYADEGDQAGSAAPEVTVEAARAAYQEALAQTDRDARAHGFARAERMFRELVRAWPDHPELLTDWGNAALGAQDIGRATLAYRRALALEPGLSRAERNLAWVRDRAPSWLPTPKTQRAGDSLFFWHHALSIPARHLVGALAFFATVLLLVPWGGQHKLRRRLAVIPALVWVAMLASVLLDDPPVHDAVIVADSVPLLSADSAGAPPAATQPLPAGAEVTVVETRGAWTRVSLPDGSTKGWVPSATVERVLPPELQP